MAELGQRNVRNFWLSAQADGSASPIAVGPKTKDGGLRATLYLREHGEVSEDKVTIDSKVAHDGGLLTIIEIPFGATIERNPDNSNTIKIYKER